MKILHILQSLDVKEGGGVTSRNLKLIEYLEKYKIDNYIITSETKNKRTNLSFIKKSRILFLKTIYIGKYPLPIPKFIKLIKLVKKVDVVHFSNFWHLLNIYAFLICRIYSKKYVLCPAGALTIFGESKFLKYLYKILIGNSIVRNSSRIIAITQKEKKDILDLGINKKKLITIPNGIDSYEGESIDYKFKETFKKYKPFILFMGRLNFIKGPDILLKAFSEISREFPSYNLVFAGPDEGMTNILKKEAKKYELNKKVFFLGFVNKIKKDYLYKNATVLVIPSRSEAMSLVVLEAGINGLISIFTNVCGLEIIEKNNLGISVDVNHHSIANAIKSFLKESIKDHKKRQLIEFINKNYNWDLVTKKYLDVFENCNVEN